VTSPAAYYNEFDPQKAAWLRELIKAGLIAPGDVDERSIKDVRPADVMGYTQCHFFAGIGVWSYALRLAGWPDDRAVWTGSCPCPSFSVAGKGEGFDDPRHLWPVWFNLIRECGPGTVFGEQADGAIGHGWLDLVSTDMEAEEYAFAAAVLGACGVGAPHRRYRLFFCADSQSRRLEQLKIAAGEMPSLLAEAYRAGECLQPTGRCGSSVVAGKCSDPDADRCFKETGEGLHDAQHHTQSCGDSLVCPESLHPQRWPVLLDGKDGRNGTDAGRNETYGIAGACSEVLELGVEIDAKFEGLEGQFGNVRDWRGPGWVDPITARSIAETGATRGYWGDCDWWIGRDGKCRPIGPGVQPLAHGVAARVVKLRGYGDAIVSETAKAFIEAYLDTERQ